MAEARTNVVDRDPELIKQDIAVARDRLALTVDSLAERTNPQRLADDLKSAVLRFLKKPAVTATLMGVGAVTIVIIVRGIRNR
jgi:membrane-bound ClpP family serine protease